MTQRIHTLRGHGRPSAGFTIVEIMVALVISLILLAGIIQIFVSAKATYNMQDGMSRVQENARFAMDFLERRVREAGFFGCSTSVGNFTNTLKNSTTNAYNFSTPAEGYEANGTGLGATYNITATDPSPVTSGSGWTATGTGSSSATLPAALVGQAIPGSDVLVIRGGGNDSVKIDHNNNSAQVFVEQLSSVTNGCAGNTNKISGLCDGDIVVITDCSKARVFQITGIGSVGAGSCTQAPCANLQHAASGTPGNAITSWGGSSSPPDERFGPGSEIVKITTTDFYVGQGANGGPSLFYLETGGTPQELVDGVENMQVLYGEDTDSASAATAGLPNRYVTAAQVTDWEKVVSARISLLLRSQNGARTDSDTSTYVLAGATAATGTTINPVDDHRLRQVYTTTIKLRNRGVK